MFIFVILLVIILIYVSRFHLTNLINNNIEFKESNIKNMGDLLVGETKVKMGGFIDMDIMKMLSSRFNVGYDYITHSILKSKKNELYRIYGSRNIRNCIKKRPHCKYTLREATKMDGCKYDKEMEMLNSLVFIDENPILYLPFYNEETYMKLVLEFMNKTLEELNSNETFPDPVRKKLEVIRITKLEFEGIINKSLLKYILRNSINL